MLLAWRDKDRQHNPMTITDQVNLGAKASPRTSQRIVFWLFELRRLVAAQCTWLGGLFSGPRSRTTGSNDRSIDAPQFSADPPHIIQLVEQGGEDSGPSTDLAPPVELTFRTSALDYPRISFGAKLRGAVRYRRSSARWLDAVTERQLP